eukprot:scaffold24321_cov119-Isochrysis_galbana.AAC.5
MTAVPRNDRRTQKELPYPGITAVPPRGACESGVGGAGCAHSTCYCSYVCAALPPLSSGPPRLDCLPRAVRSVCRALRPRPPTPVLPGRPPTP